MTVAGGWPEHSALLSRIRYLDRFVWVILPISEWDFLYPQGSKVDMFTVDLNLKPPDRGLIEAVHGQPSPSRIHHFRDPLDCGLIEGWTGQRVSSSKFYFRDSMIVASCFAPVANFAVKTDFRDPQIVA
jgi:hypothetical protein